MCGIKIHAQHINGAWHVHLPVYLIQRAKVWKRDERQCGEWIWAPINQAIGACLAQVAEHTFDSSIMSCGRESVEFGKLRNNISNVQPTSNIYAKLPHRWRCDT
jgi:hypothetical protein